MLRNAICMTGEDAARQFYDGRHFARHGAMPSVTLLLLQGKGSVQALDGNAHRGRNALLLDLLRGDAVREIGDLFTDSWRAALPDWRGQKLMVLHDAMARLLCATICTWVGVPVANSALAERTQEVAAMIDDAGRPFGKPVAGRKRR